MPTLTDLSDRQFGMLKVIERTKNGKDGATRYLCECACGNRKIVRSKHLKSGAVDNCGCKRVKRMRETKLRNGSMYGGCGTRLYRIYSCMKDRCYNKSRERYADYGGRGITVCDEWLDSFEAFRDWALNNGYRDDLSIDRIENDKSCSPENCRWVTVKEQNNNRRKRSCWKKEAVKCSANMN